MAVCRSAGHLLLLPVLALCVLAARALVCWECLGERCRADSAYQHHTRRTCPPNFLCQKTIFRFFYKPGRRAPRGKWTLHHTVVRACAAHCRNIDERPYCDAMFPNLTHPEQDMGGCVERHCCGDDLCNRSAESSSSPAAVGLAFLLLLGNL